MFRLRDNPNSGTRFQRHVFSVVRDHGGRQRRMQREQGRTQSADSGTRLYQQQWTLAAAVVAAVAVPILNGRSLPTGTYFGTTKSIHTATLLDMSMRSYSGKNHFQKDQNKF